MSERNPKYLGIEAAAVYCGMCYRLFKKMVEKYDIPYFKNGRSWFFSRRDLNAFMEHRLGKKPAGAQMNLPMEGEPEPAPAAAPAAPDPEPAAPAEPDSGARLRDGDSEIAIVEANWISAACRLIDVAIRRNGLADPEIGALLDNVEYSVNRIKAAIRRGKERAA